MRIALAAVLIAALPACATGASVETESVVRGPDPVAPRSSPDRGGPPILVATSGPDTLRFVDRRIQGGFSSGGYTHLDWSIRFAFDSTERDSLLARGPQAMVGRWSDERWDGNPVATRVEGREVVLEAANIDFTEVQIELGVVRVHAWKDHERAGLMDASLDDIEWPPYLLRCAGEGESFWLSASLMDPEKPMAPGTDPSSVLSHAWAAETATVQDAKGRVLVRHSSSIEGETALATFSTHLPGTPPPEGGPTIQYPVTVRLRVPTEWVSEVRRFRFRGLPARGD